MGQGRGAVAPGATELSMRGSGGRSLTRVCNALIDENRSMSSVAFSATCVVCPCRIESRPSCCFTFCVPTCTRHAMQINPPWGKPR